ncbi:MAG: ArnT family glycosyltransferase [Anaerolineales bacterium]
MTRSNRILWAAALLLLLQFALRAYQIDALPAYGDESLHIRRAEVAWQFTTDPTASYRPGKLLLYYYMGLFETTRTDFLLVGRLSVALATLMGGAALFALGRRLFNAQAGLLALFLYAVTPFTLFFDRMALADPLAMALMLVAVWASFKWLDRPDPARTALATVFLILAPVAKLTVGLVVAVPALLVLLFRREVWRAYLRPGVMLFGVFGAVWAVLFSPVVIGELSPRDEDRVVIVGDYLLNVHEEEQGFLENLLDSAATAFEQTAIYIWAPVLLLSGLGLLWLLRMRPRAGLFLLAAWLLMWVPVVALGSFPRSRYLEVSMPFVYLMLVGGASDALSRIREPERRVTFARAWVAGLLLYGLAWGGPFFYQAVTEPADLPLPEADRWRYVSAHTAAYGQIEAVNYMQAELPRAEASGQVQAWGMLGSCHMIRLYLAEPGPVDFTCTSFDYTRQFPPAELAAIEADAARYETGVYLLVERAMLFEFDLEENFGFVAPTNAGELAVTWEHVRDFTRPHDGVTIELWRLTPPPPGQARFAFPTHPQEP